ncbi:MAG TPA: hypothetical protein VFA68_10715 [Terriglobales bacterium]|nr:hypothetical protein [Terriglobales bacterium]
MSDVRLEVIGNPPTAVADIVFVHGMGGDCRETWMVAHQEDTFWPRWLYDDLLNTDTPCAVWSLGYPASPTYWRDRGDTMELPTRARNLLAYLVDEGLGKRSLIFIAHSLGGLLVKYILEIGSQHKDRGPRELTQHTQAVIFMATPHQGSALATLVRGLRSARCTVTMNDLRHYSSYLNEVDMWYRENVDKLNIRTLALREDRKLSPGKRLKIIPRSPFWVVDPSSADPHISGRSAIAVDADHFEICKPSARNALVYGHVKKFLAETLPEARWRQTEEDQISFLGGMAKRTEDCLCVLSCFRDSQTTYKTASGDQQVFNGSTVSPEDTSAAVYLCSMVSRVRGFERLEVSASDKVDDKDLDKHLLLVGSSLTNAHTKWALSSNNARYHFRIDGKEGFRIECRTCRISGTNWTWLPNDGNLDLDNDYSSGKATKIDYAIVQRLKRRQYDIFVLAGLGPVGTKGAAYFMYRNWPELNRMYRDQPFGVVLKFGDAEQCARFTDPLVVHRTDPDHPDNCTTAPLVAAMGKAA